MFLDIKCISFGLNNLTWYFFFPFVELKTKRILLDIFKEKQQKSAEAGTIPSFYKKACARFVARPYFKRLYIKIGWGLIRGELLYYCISWFLRSLKGN